MDIAKSVRIALAQNNQRKAWLAEKIEVTPGYITKLCKGETNITQDKIQKIADAFDIKVSELIALGEGQ